MNKIFLGAIIIFLGSCGPKNSKLSFEENVKWDQYRVNGQRLFLVNCSNCHGINGEGIAKLMPPLKNADWVTENQRQIPCMIRKGSKGQIKVNGIVFEGDMLPHEKLTHIEIAEITAYVLADLNGVDDFYDSKAIIKMLQDCGEN